MKEENEDHDHHHHHHHEIIECCPRKTLNFNAPLLSTRRPANLAAIDLSSCPSVRRRNSFACGGDDRVPFSWERAAGKPKQTSSGDEENDDTPRPKLPPSLWLYRHFIAATKTDVACDASNDVRDVSCVASNTGEGGEDDVFSLSEAIDIVERSQKPGEAAAEGLRLRIIEDRSRDEEGDDGGGGRFPDFIIERFLPDAVALAAASLERRCGDVPAKRALSPPKGCGLESILFPWRAKHRLCGVRSPDVVPRGGDHHIHRRHKDKRW